jgi:hypothetical protein
MKLSKKTHRLAGGHIAALTLGMGLAIAGATISFAQGTGGPGGAGGPGNATTGGMNTTSGNTMSAPSNSGTSNAGSMTKSNGMNNEMNKAPSKTDPKQEH